MKKYILKFKNYFYKIFTLKNILFLSILFGILFSFFVIMFESDETGKNSLGILDYKIMLYEGRRGNLYFDIFNIKSGERVTHVVLLEYRK